MNLSWRMKHFLVLLTIFLTKMILKKMILISMGWSSFSSFFKVLKNDQILMQSFQTICRRRGEKRNKFILNIRTTVRNGLVLWMNQGPTLQGDFLAVAVIDGKAELSFNLGKKTKPIRIKSKVSMLGKKSGKNILIFFLP